MATKRFPSELADKFMLRLPTGMRERIAEQAKLVGRSMNTEIVARLEKSFEDDSSAVEAAEMLKNHEDSLNELNDRLEKLEHLVSDLQVQTGLVDPNPRD